METHTQSIKRKLDIGTHQSALGLQLYPVVSFPGAIELNAITHIGSALITNIPTKVLAFGLATINLFLTLCGIKIYINLFAVSSAKKSRQSSLESKRCAGILNKFWFQEIGRCRPKQAKNLLIKLLRDKFLLSRERNHQSLFILREQLQMEIMWCNSVEELSIH